MPAEQAVVLRRMLLTSLYRQGAGRTFDEQATLVRYALDHQLGAPLGPAEQIELEDAQLLLMPFAMDVVYCRLPSADWQYDRPLPPGSPIGKLSGTLGAPTPGVFVGRLGDLTRLAGIGLPPASAVSGYLLGVEDPRPIIHNLFNISAGGGELRDHAQAEFLVLCSAPGPAAADLAVESSAARWHYYIDRAGTITRLRDEGSPVHIAGQVGRRAVVLACEGGLPGGADSAQRASLAWLVRTLAARLRLDPSRVRVLRQSSPSARQQLVAIVEGVRP
jgi:hypothetical protein